MESLEEDIKELHDQFEFPEDMILTEDDEKLFDEATGCHLCNTKLGEDKVRDH